MQTKVLKWPALLFLAWTLVACGGGGSGSSGDDGASSMGVSYSRKEGAGVVDTYIGVPTLNAGAITQEGQVITTTILSKQTLSSPATYSIDIYLPKGYTPGGPPLSIIYAADSQYLFQNIVKTVQQYGLNAIVVAVNYVDANERSVDYKLPGAQQYFKFLTQELLPMVEARYSVDAKRRTFVGYSFSGVLAVLVMLFDNPADRIFSSIVSIDGSLFVDPVGQNALEAQMFKASRQLPINLFMTCSGSKIAAGNCVDALAMFSLIMNQGFQGIQKANFTNYFGTDHGTVVVPSIKRSLTAIYGVPE